MHKRIKNYLNKPFILFLSYPLGQFYFSLTIVITAVFINVFQPFGLNNWNESHKWLIINGYLIIYAGTYWFLYMICSQLFPDYYNPHCWTRLKELRSQLVYLSLATIAGWVFIVFAIEELVWTYKTFFRMQYYNCLLGAFILPVFKYVVFPKIKSKYHSVAESAPKNTELAIEETIAEDFIPGKNKQLAVNELNQVESNSKDVALATAETNQEDYIIVNKKRIAVGEIIYIMSNRNYVYVWFLHKGKMIEVSEKCPMKIFKTRIDAFPQFLHCHESFIVNLNDIASWSTTKNKMEIQLKSCDEIITVSRTYKAFMKEVFKSHYILKK